MTRQERDRLRRLVSLAVDRREKARDRELEGQRECSSCYLILPLDEFPLRSGRTDLRQSWCRWCKAEGNAQRRARSRMAVVA